MKKILSIAFFFSLLLLMVACGEVESGVPEKRDSVVIAIASEPDTLDPTQGWGHGSSPIVQSTLVRYTSELTFENDLAVQYSLDPSGLLWHFHIRDDVYFTDGTPLRASDVAFTLEQAKTAQGAVDLSYMESAVALNDTELQVRLSQPCSIFLNTLASIGIVPEHAYDENYGRAPIGSGPYALLEWRPQEQLIFRANEDYYGGSPAIKQVTVVFMSEDAALAAVQAGLVDVAYSTASLGSTEIPGYRVEAIRSVDNRGFTMPLSPREGKETESGACIGNDVTCHRELRQAIAYGIDRQLLADVVLDGFARPAYSENDGMPWNNPECWIAHDPEYAKQLLAEGGWLDSDGDGILEKEGCPAEFSCLYPAGDSVRQALALAAAEQVLELGIKIKVEGCSWDEISQRMFSEAVMMGWGSASPNESYYLYRSEGAFLDDYYNPEGYADAQSDAYMEAALLARSPEEANVYWQKLQWDGSSGSSMRGECPWIWLVNLDHVTFVREGLSIGEQAIHPHGHGLPLIQNLQDWYWLE
ncbi:MAG: ABC transporter substrate-binding protein [Bacillota bacterium]|nr:ABC transporter substrate-binding protein [Bacillota bacterium]